MVPGQRPEQGLRVGQTPCARSALKTLSALKTPGTARRPRPMPIFCS